MEDNQKITLAIIGEKLDNFIESNQNSHDAILEQVKKTNGSVANNAQRITKLEVWINRFIGALVVVEITILPIAIVIIIEWIIQ